MGIRGIRGAVQVSANTKEALVDAVPHLIEEMLLANELGFDSVISVLFTSTSDLDADFPASAARKLPIGEIPLICAKEIDVPGAMPRVVRVLMHVESTKPRSQIHHIYLGATKSLRADLAQ